MTVLESLPCAGDYDSTQLPCSPRSLFQSDVALQTLQHVAEAEQAAMAAPVEKVGSVLFWGTSHINKQWTTPDIASQWVFTN